MDEILIGTFIIIAIVVGIVYLIFILEPKEGENLTEDYVAVCIGDVQYWSRGVGQSAVLVPRIDPETLSFLNCGK